MSEYHAGVTKPPLIVVMGVTGCGKSTVAKALGQRYRTDCADGDAFHSPESVAKMHAGSALNDADREPWLSAIGRWLRDRRDRGGVIACSALKVAYRDIIRDAVPDAFFVHLAGPQSIVEQRVRQRPDHFMNPRLVQSQYDILQSLHRSENGMEISFELPVEEIVDRVTAYRTSDQRSRLTTADPPEERA